MAINPRSSGDIGAGPKGSTNKRRKVENAKKRPKSRIHFEKEKLTNLVEPLPRDPSEIEVADRRLVNLENEKLLPPPVIPVRNTVYDRPARSRGENHCAREATISLNSKQLL